MLMVTPASYEADIPKLQQNKELEQFAEVIDLDAVRNRGRFLMECLDKNRTFARNVESDELVLVCEPVLKELAQALTSGKYSLIEQDQLYEKLYDHGRLWVEPFIERANPRHEVIYSDDYHLVTRRQNHRYTFGWCANDNEHCEGRHNFENLIEIPVDQGDSIELQNGSYIKFDAESQNSPQDLRTASYELGRVINALHTHFKKSV